MLLQAGNQKDYWKGHRASPNPTYRRATVTIIGPEHLPVIPQALGDAIHSLVPKRSPRTIQKIEELWREPAGDPSLTAQDLLLSNCTGNGLGFSMLHLIYVDRRADAEPAILQLGRGGRRWNHSYSQAALRCHVCRNTGRCAKCFLLDWRCHGWLCLFLSASARHWLELRRTLDWHDSSRKASQQ